MASSSTQIGVKRLQYFHYTCLHTLFILAILLTVLNRFPPESAHEILRVLRLFQSLDLPVLGTKEPNFDRLVCRACSPRSGTRKLYPQGLIVISRVIPLLFSVYLRQLYTHTDTSRPILSRAGAHVRLAG